MDNPYLAGMILLAVGLLLLYLGYLIRYRGKTSLLAGYRADRVADEEGLAHSAGGGVLLLGLMSVIAGVLIAVFPGMIGLLAVLYAGLIVGGTIQLIRTSGQYMKSHT